MFEAVAVDVAEFTREAVLRDVYDKLAIAEEQLERGMLLDGREVFDRLRQKYV